MKKWILALILVGMLGWAVVDFVMKNGEQQDEKEDLNIGLQIGNIAPNFELQTLEGETVRLTDYRGQPVMLNFWTSWCPPCRAEMPDMEKFYQDSGMQILAINLTSEEDTLEDVRQFKQEYELTFPILLDHENAVGERYQIRPIPTSYMVDAEGVIQFNIFGPMNYDHMMLEFGKIKK